MATTSCMDLAYTQVQPRRPWRIQGPRPSMEEEKEEEARTSFWKARNFWPPDLLTFPEPPAPESRPAPSAPTLWLSRNLARTCPELPEPGTSSLSAHSVLGRAHVPLRPHLPLRGLALYILPHLLLVRVSIVIAYLEIELCSSIRISSS